MAVLLFAAVRDGDLALEAISSMQVPPNSLLSPSDDAAVVGGNVLTSQRVTDVILTAFKAMACSYGCMNNFTFGDQGMGYYETIAGALPFKCSENTASLGGSSVEWRTRVLSAVRTWQCQLGTASSAPYHTWQIRYQGDFTDANAETLKIHDFTTASSIAEGVR